MRYSSRWADKCQTFEVRESEVDKSQEDRAKDKVADVYNMSSDAFNPGIWEIKCKGTCQNGTNYSAENGINLEYDSQFSLWFIAPLVCLCFEVWFQLEVLHECLAQDFKVDADNDQRNCHQ